MISINYPLNFTFGYPLSLDLFINGSVCINKKLSLCTAQNALNRLNTVTLSCSL